MSEPLPRLAVDIWSDVMCPWCAIGFAQFTKTVNLLEGEIDISVRWMPFELNPDMSPEGKLQSDHMADNYGSTPDQIEQMVANMQAIGRRVGFPMEYLGAESEPPVARMWNTFDAHKLLRWVLAEHGNEGAPGPQTRLKLAMFRANFQQRRNMSDRQVLLDIVEAEGFDRAKAAEALDDEALTVAVRVEEQRGLAANISSVPSFVVEGQYLLPGAREPEAYANALRKVASMMEETGDA